MTEFIDLMLDGVICRCCGQFLGDATAFPISCEGCEKRDASEHTERLESELNIPASAIAAEELGDDLPF